MRVRLKSTGLSLAILAITSLCQATDFASLLTPPKGARIAVVLFEDLEWPDCAAAHPLVREIAQAYNVPVVVHDFPLPRHNWSFQAAVDARFFENKSQKLGEEFRGYILRNQRQIADESLLRKYVEQFAAERQIALPIVLDPGDHLAQQVHADFLLGQRLGLEHTPTLFVVGAGKVSIPIVESVTRERLGNMIEDMQKKPAVGAAPARPAAVQRKRRT